jgi:hypothetical protein
MDEISEHESDDSY